jgi:hypothetical protein
VQLASGWIASMGIVGKKKPKVTRHFGSNCLVWDATMGLARTIVALIGCVVNWSSASHVARQRENKLIVDLSGGPNGKGHAF